MLTSKDSKEMIEDPICLREENTGTHYIGISCLSVRIMTKRKGLKQCKHLKIPQINECAKKKEERKDQLSYLKDLAKTPDALKHLAGGMEKMLLWN